MEFLVMDVTVLVHFHFQPLGKGVDDRRADAVKTAGYFVSAAAEFTAGVKNGQNDGNRRNAQFFINADRNAAAVVTDFNNVVR